MFNIQLSPVAGNSNTAISADGDILTINGTEIDFSVIPDGGSAEGSDPIIGEVKNVSGNYDLTIRFEYDSKTALPNQSTRLSDYSMTLNSGQLLSPIVQKPVEVSNAE